jgi:hypothetical protein
MMSGNSSYTYFAYDEWPRAYSSDLIQYGDIYLGFDRTGTNVTVDADSGAMAYDFFPSDIDMNQFRDAEDGDIFRFSPLASDNWLNLTKAFPSANPSTWGNVTHAVIVGALGVNVPSRSRIQLSLRFMIIVIICNAVKLGMMIWVLLWEKSEFIVTLGDGAASYLETPDPNTEGLCVLSKDAIVTMVGPHNVRDKKSDMFGMLLNEAYGIWHKRYHTYSSTLDRDRELGSSFM